MKRIWLASLVILSMSILLTSCALRSITVSSDSRARYHYWYYPTAGIYFDYEQKVYYYPDNGTWRRSEELPSGYSADGSYVQLDMDSDKPYTRYEEHHRKYPGRHRKDNHDNRHRDDQNNDARDTDNR